MRADPESFLFCFISYIPYFFFLLLGRIMCCVAKSFSFFVFRICFGGGRERVTNEVRGAHTTMTRWNKKESCERRGEENWRCQ